MQTSSAFSVACWFFFWVKGLLVLERSYLSAQMVLQTVVIGTLSSKDWHHFLTVVYISDHIDEKYNRGNEFLANNPKVWVHWNFIYWMQSYIWILDCPKCETNRRLINVKQVLESYAKIHFNANVQLCKSLLAHCFHLDTGQGNANPSPTL